MNILVTGGQGQLGTALQELAGEYGLYHFTFIDIRELDLTDNVSIARFMNNNRFDGIINCAAYTAVDRAESEPQLASILNSGVPQQLAGIARQKGQWMIHISTDYVFDGQNHRPYVESDPTNPDSEYGRTKLEGEKAVISSGVHGLILRTSWLYSGSGTNFAKTIFTKGREKGELKVVQDQIGTPTYARDMARMILDIIPEMKLLEKPELYHFSNEGVASWYDFAKAVVEFGEITCKIHPVETKDYPTPAVRPFYSVLSKSKIRDRFGIVIPFWRDSLKECISKYGKTWGQ